MIRAYWVFGWLLPLVAGVAGPAARGQVSSIHPQADAFVASAQPESNFGGAGALSIAAPGLPGGEFQTVLRFDAAAIQSSFDALFGPGQWSVQSATLQLAAVVPNNPIFNPPAAGDFAVSWVQNDGWVEGTGGPGAPTQDGITFNTLSSFLGGGDEDLGTFAYDGTTGVTHVYPLLLGSGFAADLASGELVSLHLFAADSAVSYVFNSRHFGIAANRPVLSVTAVPEPGSLAFLALAALAGLRRRRAG